jgi:hypothetical protein
MRKVKNLPLTILLLFALVSCENNTTAENNDSKSNLFNHTPNFDNTSGTSVSVNALENTVTVTFTPQDEGLGYARALISFDHGALKWAQNASHSLKFDVSTGVQTIITFDRFYDSSSFDVPDITGSHSVQVEIWGVDVSGDSIEVWTNPKLNKSYTNSAMATPSINLQQGNFYGYYDGADRYLPRLTWSSIDDAEGYKVFHSTNGVSYAQIATLSSATLVYNDPGDFAFRVLPQDKFKTVQTVYYKVVAYRTDIGASEDSNDSNIEYDYFRLLF